MRKHLFFISTLLLPLFVSSQIEEIKTDSLSSRNLFIEDFSNQLNVKLDVTNSQVKYFIPYEGRDARIRTNQAISYGLVLSYKVLSFRLAIRPKLSENELENKGKTDNFRMRVKLLFDKWTHRLEFNYNRGFYIENTSDFDFENNIDNPSFKVQFPYLTTNILSGSSRYKFNDNYSVKALESNTEIQLKSAGTFQVGLNYALYFLKGTQDIKVADQDFINRDSYKEYTGFSPVFNAGYHYTFVFHNYWFVNAYGNPGMGVDFYNTKLYENNNVTNSSNAKLFFAFRTGITAGFNGKKIYFGGTYNYYLNTVKLKDKEVNLQPRENNFHLFLGYRFKAPKQVRKSVDYIEKNVPVFKKDSN